MVKDFSTMPSLELDLYDREKFLRACGLIVIEEICDMIKREKQPDGSAQKQNSPEYKKMKLRTKGYTTPLWGVAGGARSIKYHKTHEVKGLYAQVTADYTKPQKQIGGKSTGRISPYLGTKAAWTRAFFEPDTLEIFPNTDRYMIMVYLQSKGYWFMGITDRAEKLIRARMSNYFRNKKEQMISRNRILGMQREGML